jgi:hypothetical protein
MIYKYRITGDSGAIFIVGVFPAITNIDVAMEI